MTAQRRVRIVVRGRVQGVGYRWFARETAQSLGVAGWVRNAPDGSVEAEAAAAADVLDRFVAALQRGPTRAVVSSVDVHDVEGIESLASPFEIAR